MVIIQASSIFFYITLDGVTNYDDKTIINQTAILWINSCFVLLYYSTNCTVHMNGIVCERGSGHVHFCCRVRVVVLNVTFNDVSVISRRSVLLVKETWLLGGKPQTWHKSLTTLSHNVVSSTPLERDSNSAVGLEIRITYYQWVIFVFPNFLFTFKLYHTHFDVWNKTLVIKRVLDVQENYKRSSN